jgi:hypothetical protein
MFFKKASSLKASLNSTKIYLKSPASLKTPQINYKILKSLKKRFAFLKKKLRGNCRIDQSAKQQRFDDSE